MSYCRWSCLDFKSDVYVYANINGAWTIHVAGNRVLPHACETFDTASPGECADKLQELADLGYCVPDWVIPDLRSEQADIDADPEEPQG